MFFFFHISFIIINLYIVCSNIISFEFPYYSIHPNIKLTYILFNKTLTMPFTTLDKYTFLNPDSNYLKECILKFSETNITLPDQKVPGQPCETDLIYENQTIISKFKFYVLTNYVSTFDIHGYSLAFSVPNEEYSFMNQLMSEHHLKKKMFSFQMNSKKGIIHFGGLPIDETKNYKYSNKFTVKSSNWTCFLKKIKIGNQILEINRHAIIDTSVDGYIDSKEFFYFIAHNISKIKTNDSCSIITEDFSFKDILLCNTEFINKMEDILLEFEDSKYIKFKPSQLFDSIGGQAYSKITYDFLYDIHEHFVLGFEFLRNMNLSIFDYEEKTISFYSDIYQMNHNSFCLHYYLFIVTEILLTISSGILIYIHVYFRKL